MKPPMTIADFLENNTQWLAQFECMPLFSTLLALCDQSGLYMLDKAQNVVYWSISAQLLTGLKSAALLGKPCPVDYQITSDTEVETNHAPLKKMTRVLHDKAGQVAGGLGLIFVDALQPKLSTLPKLSSQPQQNFQGILSRSPAMQDTFQIIRNAAETTANVLVRGESGAGKELVARAIHDLSIRRDAPFLAINCAALSSNLLESELFGHVRGAFTGAIKDHSGLFQRANGGTLFLDEVAELPLELQAKLLRVLQERNYIPVGGDHELNTDVRIVAATHRSLREEVRNGRFREDLMYRLRVVPIFIPPLRERREDVSLLIWHFIGQHNLNDVRRIEKIEPQAMKALLDYAWPGNVRELHNVVEYAFAVGRGNTLRYSELPPEFRESKVVLPKATRHTQKPTISLTPEQELAAIQQALAINDGSVTAAAQALGMSRATFWRKRKLYGL